MTAIFELAATKRQDIGKGASRRLRRKQNFVPAIVYGSKEQPLTISLDHNKVLQALENEAFYSHILIIDIDGKKTKAILKDLQRHHFKRSIMHMDFQRVQSSDVITMKIPLHFTGQDICPGIKAGGILYHQAIDLEVRCKVSDLPEFINVDISKLALDEAIHLKDITIPANVTLHTGHDKDYNPTIVSVHFARGKIIEEPTPTATATTTTAAKADDSKKAAAATGKTPAAAPAKKEGTKK